VQTITRLDPLRSALDALRADGPLALVPTMGALHEGHLTLVREARARAAHVVVSIFVNPRQFGANEDLDAYPRQLARDAALLEAEGVSLGEKAWQQLAVIRRMARDLDLTQPHVDAIIGVPTVREADGLAMSSRNAYLSPEQRQQAASLPQAMQAAIWAMSRGEPVEAALLELQEILLAGGFSSIDYAEVRDPDSLAPVSDPARQPARLFVAARIGGTRLIDNQPVTHISKS